MDFAIALLLFIFTLVVYFSYTTNFQKQEKGELDTMITDAKSISSSLVLSGYPTDWGNTTVIRIGIADEQKVNATKVKAFKQYDYKKSKRLFGTIYDYAVFFINDKGDILNINSVCVLGYPLINTTYNIRSAYYYQDSDDSFLLNFMNETFKADIYKGGNGGDLNDIDGLITNLSKYGFLVMEHPAFPTSTLNDHYRELNNYTSRGGLFFISGQLVSAASGRDLNGIAFDKKTGQSSAQRTAVVNNTDEYLSLNIGDSMVFDQYYFVSNGTPPTIEADISDDDYNPHPAVNFKIIATYNNTDNDKAIAKWQYGNGTVYFFSDFDVSDFSGDFVSLVEDASSGFAGGYCNPINFTAISPKHLAKTERYLIYNSKTAKMLVYVWQ